jgi:hypothetical protein
MIEAPGTMAQIQIANTAMKSLLRMTASSCERGSKRLFYEVGYQHVADL